MGGHGLAQGADGSMGMHGRERMKGRPTRWSGSGWISRKFTKPMGRFDCKPMTVILSTTTIRSSRSALEAPSFGWEEREGDWTGRPAVFTRPPASGCSPKTSPDSACTTTAYPRSAAQHPPRRPSCPFPWLFTFPFYIRSVIIMKIRHFGFRRVCGCGACREGSVIFTHHTN